MDFDMIDIFKIPIFCKKILLDNEKIFSFCVSQKMQNEGMFMSNIGGWQSKPMYEISDSIIELFSTIHELSFDICNQMQLSPVSLQNAWININGYLHHNITHIHPHSVLSGVYYVKTPEKCGDIFFNHPAHFLMEYDWNKKKNYNNYNSNKFRISAEEGLLCLFPSWLSHGVEPNCNQKEERISISFNLG